MLHVLLCAVAQASCGWVESSSKLLRLIWFDVRGNLPTHDLRFCNCEHNTCKGKRYYITRINGLRQNECDGP